MLKPDTASEQPESAQRFSMCTLPGKESTKRFCCPTARFQEDAPKAIPSMRIRRT
jgi:hypothetical protein